MGTRRTHPLPRPGGGSQGLGCCPAVCRLEICRDLLSGFHAHGAAGLLGGPRVRLGWLWSNFDSLCLPSRRYPSSLVCERLECRLLACSQWEGIPPPTAFVGSTQWTLYSSVLPALQGLTRVTRRPVQQLLGLTLAANKAIPGPSISVA